MAKDVHTEHCCIVHGCKYGKDEECTVVQKRQPQSYPCESCSNEGMDPTKGTPETNIYNFKVGHYYKFLREKDANPALLYVMGFMLDAQKDMNLICNVHMISDFLRTMKLDFVSSIQGVKIIMKSQWEEISEDEFNKLKIEYANELMKAN